MQKILLLLAKIHFSIGRFWLLLLARKVDSDAKNAEIIMRGVMDLRVGTFQTIPPRSEPLQIPSQPAQPTEDIKKIMTLLAFHKSITAGTRRSGSKPLAIFKNELERSIN